MLESILKQSIMHHLQRTEAISKSQHGFLPKKLCLTNLLAMEEKVTKIMDSGDTVDLVFLDFSKAFDSVYHRFYIKKLKAYGINDKVVNWIESFLKERTFNVSIS